MNIVTNVDRDKILDIVQRLDFFRKFSVQEQRLVVDMRTHLYTCEKDEVIITAGSPDTSLFIILKGSVSVSKDGSEKPIALLYAGDTFGEIAFITGEQRTADIAALEQVIVLKIDRSTFDRLDVTIREKIKDNFIAKLVERLDRMNNAFVNRWK